MKPKFNEKSKQNVLVKAEDWFRKIHHIKNEIESLERIKNVTSISVSVFLLKSQLIEFELKQLFTSIDQHLIFSSSSKIIKLKIRTPSFLDNQRQTLGSLIDELDRYESELLELLKEKLKKLKKIRNAFTHNLFSPGSLGDLTADAEKGIQLANEALKELELIDNVLIKTD